MHPEKKMTASGRMPLRFASFFSSPKLSSIRVDAVIFLFLQDFLFEFCLVILNSNTQMENPD